MEIAHCLRVILRTSASFFMSLYPSISAQASPLSLTTRYCPSIEDKIVKFAEKESHQVGLYSLCALSACSIVEVCTEINIKLSS